MAENGRWNGTVAVNSFYHFLHFLLYESEMIKNMVAFALPLTFSIMAASSGNM